jgi:NAD-dependent DNA ligase
MIFGSKNRFAIESEIVENVEFNFGRICFWVEGTVLGDYDTTVILNPIADFLSTTLSYEGERHDQTLLNVSPEQALSQVYSALYGGDTSTHQAPTEEQLHSFQKLSICPNGCEAFDGELVILLEDDKGERFIWREFTQKVVHVMQLELGEYERAVGEFLAWLAASTGYSTPGKHFLDKVFVFAGDFSPNRKNLEGLVVRHGGRLHHRVSERTSYLIVGKMKEQPGDKLSQARALNIPVLSEEEFLSLLPKELE